MFKCFEPYVLCEIVWAPHELNYEFTSQTWFAARASSRLFSGRNDTRERWKLRLVT